MMKFEQVINNSDSSLINNLWYAAKDQCLMIEFKNNRSYMYFGVPRRDVDAFGNAASLGKFFHENIRGFFQFVAAK